MTPSDSTPPSAAAPPGFLRKVLIAVGVISLFIAVGLLLWSATSIFLLVFVAILLATFLEAPAGLLSRRTAVPHGLALAGVVLLLLAVTAGFWLLAGPRLADEAARLVDLLPESVERVQEVVESLPGGPWLLDRVSSMEGGALRGASLVGNVTGTASAVWEALARIVFVVILGLYLAASPRTYRDGLAALVPPAYRDRGVEVLNELGRALQGWLLGQLTAMVAIGLLTGLALWILGVPLAFVLGVLAGLFEFVPIVGPIIGFLPAILLASTQGLTQVLWVLGAYVIIQQLEGNVVTPLVQRRAVDLPPALTLTAVFVAGAALGPLGFLVATPLAALGMVLVQMLYRHDLLGEEVETVGGGPD